MLGFAEGFISVLVVVYFESWRREKLWIEGDSELFREGV